MANSGRAAMAAAWSACAIAAAVLVLRGVRPWPLVLVCLALASAAPEKDDGAWGAFVQASLGRIADTVLMGAIAWRLGWLDGDVGGAAAAVTLLSSSLVSSYVRIRAASLGIDGGSLSRLGTAGERSVRLGLVAAGLAGPLTTLLWIAAAFTLALSAVRSAGVWHSASHG